MRSEVLARVCFLPGNPRRRRRRLFPAERRPPRSRLRQRAAERGAGAGLQRRVPLHAPGSLSFPVSNFVWPASHRTFLRGPGQPPQVRTSVGVGQRRAPEAAGAAPQPCSAPLLLACCGLRGNLNPGCGGAGRACPGRKGPAALRPVLAAWQAPRRGGRPPTVTIWWFWRRCY